MAAPIVYRWDDGNAPVARGERRSLCDILHACLVTGYGDKPAAGWTREYVNATFDKAAFRNNPVTGTGFFLQVDGAGGSVANSSQVRAFETMTSENDGLFPFAVADEYFTSSTANTVARPWILIADDRAFYMWTWSTLTAAPGDTDSAAHGLFFGDGVRRDPNDAYFCGLALGSSLGRGALGYLYTVSAAAASVGQGLAVPRPANGVSSPFFAALIQGGGPGAVTYAGQHGLPYTAGDPILVSRPHVNDGQAYSFRGFLPGFYCPCHPLAFNQFANVTAGGKSFLSLRVNITTTAGNLFIDLADWRV